MRGPDVRPIHDSFMMNPLLLVTGFLGSGKTTFLRQLLPILEARQLAPYVIINDYANAKVDAASLREDGREVAPINGNCICCDSVLELLNVLLEIPEASNRVVAIEANGTTDPTALLEHLLVNPKLRERYAPIVQLTVVDVSRWQKRHWHNDLERLQVETASHLLFTREEVSTQTTRAVLDDIEFFNAKAETTDAEQMSALLESLVRSPGTAVTEPPADDKHDHDHEHRHQLAHAFVGLEMRLPEWMTARSLASWIGSLPNGVLRAKGIVRLKEKPNQWLQFNRLDNRPEETDLYELSQPPDLPPCAVLIGVGLDRAELEARLMEAMAE